MTAIPATHRDRRSLAATDGLRVACKSPAQVANEVAAEAADLAVTWRDHAKADAWAQAELKRRGGASSHANLNTEAPSDVFVVDHDNVDAVRLFLACATQWRVSVASSLAGSTRSKDGLDYAGVSIVARALNLALEGILFDAIQCLERAALEVEAMVSQRDFKKRGVKKGGAKGGRS